MKKLTLLFLVTVSALRSGTLTFSQSTVANLCAQGTALGDMNGDGFLDIIVAEGEFSPGALAWYKYPNWEKYDIHPTAFSELDYVPDCQTEDMDGDGDIDLVIPNSVNGGNKSLWWFENPLAGGGDPESGMARHVVWSASDNHIKNISVADFDGDGKPDIVIRLTDRMRLFFQNSADSWTQISWTNGISDGEGMGTGDIDRDGEIDVITNGIFYKNPGNRVDAWTLKTIGNYTQGNDTRSIAVDIDGDGNADPVFSGAEYAGRAVSWYSTADPDDSYYVVVKHRNHIEIMSAAAMSLE